MALVVTWDGQWARWIGRWCGKIIVGVDEDGGRKEVFQRLPWSHDNSVLFIIHAHTKKLPKHSDIYNTYDVWQVGYYSSDGICEARRSFWPPIPPSAHFENNDFVVSEHAKYYATEKLHTNLLGSFKNLLKQLLKQYSSSEAEDHLIKPTAFALETCGLPQAPLRVPQKSRFGEQSSIGAAPVAAQSRNCILCPFPGATIPDAALVWTPAQLVHCAMCCPTVEVVSVFLLLRVGKPENQEPIHTSWTEIHDSPHLAETCCLHSCECNPYNSMYLDYQRFRPCGAVRSRARARDTSHTARDLDRRLVYYWWDRNHSCEPSKT